MNKLINQQYDAVIIGGGFFGCALALFLKKKKINKILIVEKDHDLMQRASYGNQARVHNGYHYPRSIMTAYSSRVNFPKFVRDYSESVFSNFEKYYAIPKIYSKVTANQYRLFCERIGAPIKKASKEIKKLFNEELIEEVFEAKEYAFDAVKLKERMKNDLTKEKIEINLNTYVDKLQKNDHETITIYFNKNQRNPIISKKVFNCTYSKINQILKNSNLPLIPLKHELTEMALIKVPEELQNLGITVMCGPFFSTMPFPPRKLHTLSHVRYTPHHYWHDSEEFYMDAHEYFEKIPKRTKYEYIIRDASRYLPILKESKYIDSIWEVKTILPINEVDDGRPILLKKDYGIKNLTCIMGGKIDNVYDVFKTLT